MLGKWGSLYLLELAVSTTLTKSRFKAYIQQAGLCIYCEQPMWLTDIDTFAKTYQISIKRAKCLKCTAEHLKAKQYGGTDAENNIAAACSYCNQKRHKRKTPLDPIAYKQHVVKHLVKGLWHSMVIKQFSVTVF
jgi:5-methylcytosine-specific restriction endonuclease McrA